MPGSGKTTLGPKIAAHLLRPFFDLDAFIEQQEGRLVPELFKQLGEAGFRDKEAQALKQLTGLVPKAVIATGGGTPCFRENMRFMNETGFTVYLDTPVPELVERLTMQGLEKRPLLAGKNKAELETYLTETLRKRQQFYRQAVLITRVEGPVTGFLGKLINALSAGA